MPRRQLTSTYAGSHSERLQDRIGQPILAVSATAPPCAPPLTHTSGAAQGLALAIARRGGRATPAYPHTAHNEVPRTFCPSRKCRITWNMCNHVRCSKPSFSSKFRCKTSGTARTWQSVLHKQFTYGSLEVSSVEWESLQAEPGGARTNFDEIDRMDCKKKPLTNRSGWKFSIKIGGATASVATGRPGRGTSEF